MMKYSYKAMQELFWSCLTAGSTVLLIALVSFNPDQIGDWKAWAIGIGAGMVRNIAGAALDWLRRGITERGREDPASLYPVLHDACRHVAFMTTQAPLSGAAIDVTEIYHIDGHPIEPGSVPVCAGCGLEFEHVDIQNGAWVTHTKVQAVTP